MNADKQKRLEADGWKFGSAAEFLEFTAEEEAQIENKLMSREQPLNKCFATEECDDEFGSR